MNAEKTKEYKLWLIYAGIMALMVASIAVYAMYFGN